MSKGEARRLVLATRNAHKVEELTRILATLEARFESLRKHSDAPEVDEDGTTFEANATKKAREIARFTGLLSIADDSGLEVDALGGAPGVRSARYGGEPADDARNRAKLLKAMAEVADAARTARFRCVLAIARPNGEVLTADGACEGRIARVEAGSGGFGYDAMFIPAGETRTFAEMSDLEKDARSHRAVAAKRAAPLFARFIASA